MINKRYKTEPTEFMYVYKTTYYTGTVRFVANMQRYEGGKKKHTSKNYDTIREAAIAVDKYLISQGKEPVNILVRK